MRSAEESSFSFVIAWPFLARFTAIAMNLFYALRSHGVIAGSRG